MLLPPKNFPGLMIRQTYGKFLGAIVVSGYWLCVSVLSDTIIISYLNTKLKKFLVSLDEMILAKRVNKPHLLNRVVEESSAV